MKKWIKTAAALATALTMAATAQASEWNFYGSARIETFYTDVDNAGGTSDKNFNQSLQANSRIGAKVRVSDELKARFEYGADDGTANIRQLWGEWDFGGGNLLVGQTYTPIYTVYSNSVYDSGDALQGYGAISVSRKPMLRLKFGGFQIAAVSPKTDDLDTGLDIETTLPKLEAAYEGDFNNLSFKVSGAYQTYEIDDTYDVDTYLIGFGGKFKFGAGFLAATVYTGQNLGPYGFKDGEVDMSPDVTGGRLIDNEAMGYTLIAGYKLSDMLAFEAGYGYQEGEDDDAAEAEEATQYYLQAKVTMAPGVYVVPEIGVRDDEDNSKGSETTYIGAKWQINF